MIKGDLTYVYSLKVEILGGNKGEEMRRSEHVKRFFAVSLFVFMAVMLWSAGAEAALEVSFTQESTALSVGEEGFGEITVANPDPGNVSDGELVVTLPDDYTVTDAGGGVEVTGPPHTITWSGLSIPGGDSIQREFRAYPRCNAMNLQQMDAQINPGGATAISSPSVRW